MSRSVVVVTRSILARDKLEALLYRAGMQMWHQTAIETACGIARRNGCPLLCTPEQEWQSVITILNQSDAPAPPVIIVVASDDRRFSATAFSCGAFDVVALSDPPSVILDCISRAAACCERALLVRAALRQGVSD